MAVKEIDATTIAALLKGEHAQELRGSPFPRDEQFGPLRWYDVEMRCAARRCNSPTYCKVDGIPNCTMHALKRLNDVIVQLTAKGGDTVKELRETDAPQGDEPTGDEPAGDEPATDDDEAL